MFSVSARRSALATRRGSSLCRVGIPHIRKLPSSPSVALLNMSGLKFSWGRRRLRLDEAWRGSASASRGPAPRPPPRRPRPPPTTPLSQAQTTQTEFSSSFSTSAAVSSLIGLAAGTMGSMVGLGGGFLMVPLLTSPRLLVSLPQAKAHGTSLFAVAATGLAGAASYAGVLDSASQSEQHTDVRWEVAAMVAVCGMGTVQWGARTTAHLSERSLKTAMGCLMLVAAPLVSFKPQLMNAIQQWKQSQRQVSLPNGKSNGESQREHAVETTTATSDWWSQTQTLLPAGTVGLLSGYLSGLLGIGGGVIVVPALTAAIPDLTHHQAIGTSLCAMILPSLLGTWTHYQKANVVSHVAVPLSIGAALGAWGGGQVARHVISEDALRLGFGVLMVVLASRSIAPSLILSTSRRKVS